MAGPVSPDRLSGLNRMVIWTRNHHGVGGGDKMLTSIIEMPENTIEASRKLEGMFRLRHEVFKERLAWEVGSVAGKERDLFDDLDPVYIVCEHEGQGYWLANTSVGLRSADARYSATLWVKNLFGEKYLVSGLANTSLGFIELFPGLPRTFGVTLAAKF